MAREIDICPREDEGVFIRLLVQQGLQGFQGGIRLACGILGQCEAVAGGIFVIVDAAQFRLEAFYGLLRRGFR